MACGLVDVECACPKTNRSARSIFNSRACFVSCRRPQVGLSDPQCSGTCFPGYFCPSGSTSPFEQKCGGTGLYCPAGSSAPIKVSTGYYGVHAGPRADLLVRHLGLLLGWKLLAIFFMMKGSVPKNGLKLDLLRRKEQNGISIFPLMCSILHKNRNRSCKGFQYI